MRRLLRFCRAEGGQTVIEFALAVIVLLVIVLGIFDLGRAVWYSNTLALATREAARCALVAGLACTGSNTPGTVVANYSIGVNPAATVTTTYCSLPPSDPACPNNSTAVGGYVTVTATSVFTPIASRFFLNGALNVTLTGSSTQFIRQNVASAPTATPSTAPTVTSISPAQGLAAGGTAITITGTRFVTGATVTLGGSAATGVTVVSATQITATTSTHAPGTVYATVTNPDGQSGTGGSFAYLGTPPTVTSISPTSGPAAGGTAVTITGTGFLAGATVTLGGNVARSVVVVSDTSITAVTAAHAGGVVDVTVRNIDTQVATCPGCYTYVPGPTVTSISPTSGFPAGGASVTITGTGFVSGATVTIGGSTATGVSVVSATQITATTPAHAAGTVNVTVTNPDTQSGTCTNCFTYRAAPTVTAISPTSGLTTGGDAVTITGTGFVTGATVTIGGSAATGVTVLSATSITANTPVHVVGTVSVTVTNTDAQSGTLTNSFTYIAGCTVPNLVGTKRNNPAANTAQTVWNNAGFTTTVLYSPDPGGNWTIATQNIAAGLNRACATTVITVGP